MKTLDARGLPMTTQNKHIGPSLDDFLEEEGILTECRAIALTEALAHETQKTKAPRKKGQ
jgi:hypothetical protein